ncbi:uncharacterized protein LOC112569522 isoform X2 [Pomacea canaliculata]|uniref:uncharacterized protein LOC112569522 isoform X2 n=1 Tax=Pomacea canaliculata TaxID=400727 RepID=UPI000D72B292|nr:uncharacterized protein LOC112569522 isoform X2 [Pomacea canaliculata]
MKILFFFGFFSTALSQHLFQMGFTSNATIENFKVFDMNLDDVIHLSEVFTVARKMDTNDDGVVSLQELTAMNSDDLPPLQDEIFFNYMDSLDSTVDGVADSSFICTYFSLMDVDNNRKATLGEYKIQQQQIQDHLKKELKDIAGC